MQTGFFAFDVETTGLDPKENEIISIAAVILDEQLQERDVLEVYAMPEKGIDPVAAEVNGFTTLGWQSRGAVSQYTLSREIVRFTKEYSDLIPLGHNVSFDVDFLRSLYEQQGLSDEFKKTFSYHKIDTVGMAVAFDLVKFGKKAGEYKLAALCPRFGVDLDNAHNALDDIKATVNLYKQIVRGLGGKEDVEIHAPSRYKRFIEQKDGEWVLVKGKHKGETLTKVAQVKPDYIEWMLDKVDNLSPEHIQILKDSINIQ